MCHKETLPRAVTGGAATRQRSPSAAAALHLPPSLQHASPEPGEPILLLKQPDQPCTQQHHLVQTLCGGRTDQTLHDEQSSLATLTAFSLLYNFPFPSRPSHYLINDFRDYITISLALMNLFLQLPQMTGTRHQLCHKDKEVMIQRDRSAEL